MKKIAVISTNYNPDYAFWLPICEAFWNRAGYECFAFTNGESKHLDFAKANFKGQQYHIGNIQGVRHETISQVSRLFAHVHNPDSYIITGDVDMLQLDKDYWQPNEQEISVYGHDLTEFKDFPMCYIGMSSEKWAKYMPAKTVEEGIADLCNVRYKHSNTSNDFYQWWDIDQKAITAALKGEKIQHYPRGTDSKNGKAKGRYDRGGWVAPSCRIDAHMPRNKWALCKHLVNDYFDFNEYANGFYSLPPYSL